MHALALFPSIAEPLPSHLFLNDVLPTNSVKLDKCIFSNYLTTKPVDKVSNRENTNILLLFFFNMKNNVLLLDSR